jgi:hypothetical protein
VATADLGDGMVPRNPSRTGASDGANLIETILRDASGPFWRDLLTKQNVKRRSFRLWIVGICSSLSETGWTLFDSYERIFWRTLFRRLAPEEMMAPACPPDWGHFLLAAAPYRASGLSPLIPFRTLASGVAVTRFESPFLVYRAHFRLPNENIRRSKIS